MIFRKITVKDKEFLWHYGFDDCDYQIDSQIVIKDCARKGKMIIKFHSNGHGYCPFNEGLKAVKDEKETLINFNRPKYIAEILTYILDSRLHDNGFDTTQEYKDGLEILAELGYIFDYRLDWSKTS